MTIRLSPQPLGDARMCPRHPSYPETAHSSPDGAVVMYVMSRGKGAGSALGVGFASLQQWDSQKMAKLLAVLQI